MGNRLLLLLICIAVTIPLFSEVIYTIYPEGKGLESIEGVKADIDERLSKGENDDFIVMLSDGIYTLDGPLIFNPEEWKSNKYSIQFNSIEGANPVISGGDCILSWESYNEYPGIVKTNAGKDIRNLWVGGERMPRAQGFVGYATGIFNETVEGNNIGGLLFKKEGFPDFRDISGLEIKYYKDWRCYYFKVDTILDSSTLSLIPEEQILVACKNFDVVLAQTPQINWLGTGKSYPYYFENAIDLLDEPGEWCYSLSDGALYFYLGVGENVRNIEVFVPRLEKILSVESSSRNHRALNLVFRGIEFSYCGWTWPSRHGFVTHQSSVYYTGVGQRGNIPAAVSVEDAKGVKFEDCKFSRLGTSGLYIKNNVEDASVQRCEFLDLSGTAISVSDPNHRTYTDSILPLKDIVIKNNLINNIGMEYANSSAIEVFYAEDVEISHNELNNCPYTGISVGWGWTPDITTQRNFKVLDNRIIGDTQKCGDGGAIYTLSNFDGEGCVIEGNFIDEISCKPIQGLEGAIYTDECSSNVRINNNVVMTERRWYYCNSAIKVEVDSTYVMQENRDFYGGRGTEVTYVEDGAHIFCLPDPRADKIFEHSGIEKNPGESGVTDVMYSQTNFCVSTKMGQLRIYTGNENDDTEYRICVYGIDGRMERDVVSDLRQPVFIDGLSSGFHIVEISNDSQRGVYKIWI